jgi:hypothetical protein
MSTGSSDPAKPLAETTALQLAPDESILYAVTVARDFNSVDCSFIISSVDVSDGSLRWSSTVPKGARSCHPYWSVWNQVPDAKLSPDGKRLYVSTTVQTGQRFDDHDQLVGLTTAFDVSDGSVKWQQETPVEGNGFVNWHLAVSRDDEVFVSSSPIAFSQTDGGLLLTEWQLRAFAGDDGDPLWTAHYDCRRVFGAPGADNDYKFCNPPDIATADRTVFLAGSNSQINNGTSQIVAFDASSGDKLWSADDDPRGGYLYASSRALVAGGGKVVSGHVLLPPTVAVAGFSPRLEAPRYVTIARSARTGELLWRQEVEANTPKNGTNCPSCGPFLAADRDLERVYLSGSFPVYQSLVVVAAFDGASGARLWDSTTSWDLSSIYLQYPRGMAVSGNGDALAISGMAAVASPTCAINFLSCSDFAVMTFNE